MENSEKEKIVRKIMAEVERTAERVRWEEFQQRRRISGIKTIIHN